MGKTSLILVLSFLVPFIIGGLGAWLWTVGMSDNPHAGGGGLLSDKEIADAENEISADARKQFVIVGFVSGLSGFGLSGAVILLIRRFRRNAGRLN
jgi:hypothetical protein